MLSQEVSPGQSIQKCDQGVLLALVPTPFVFVLGASAAPASHQIGFSEAPYVSMSYGRAPCLLQAGLAQPAHSLLLELLLCAITPLVTCWRSINGIARRMAQSSSCRALIDSDSWQQ